MRDVMLSQLNYRAAAWLNDGAEPRRLPFGAHSYYVPAQLFPTAGGSTWRCSLPTTGSGGRSPLRQASRRRAPTGSRRWRSARRGARRSSRSWRRRWPRTPPTGWEARLRAAGVPAVAVRTLPDALARADASLITAGGFRLVGGAMRVDGYEPSYGAGASSWRARRRCERYDGKAKGQGGRGMTVPQREHGGWPSRRSRRSAADVGGLASWPAGSRRSPGERFGRPPGQGGERGDGVPLLSGGLGAGVCPPGKACRGFRPTGRARTR